MIGPLTDTSFEEIHDAFIDAFSEYEVKMDISMEKLEEMLTTRSFSKEYSLGYYDGSSLAGFLLTGFREIGGERVFYDTGTGIRQKYQKQGIGNLLVEQAITSMSRHNISSFVLEVLENNTAARDLYRKHGFSVTRKFNCYETADADGEADRTLTAEIVNALPDGIDRNRFCSFRPSWQNAYESYLNVREKYNLIRFGSVGVLAGYAIIHRETGSILQIGIAPEFRRAGILKGILLRLRRFTESPVLRHLNIEENSEIDNLFRQIGIPKTVSQFEMIYRR